MWGGGCDRPGRGREGARGGFGQVPPAPAPLSPAPAAHRCGFPWKPRLGPVVPDRGIPSIPSTSSGRGRSKCVGRHSSGQGKHTGSHQEAAQGKELHQTQSTKSPGHPKGSAGAGLCPPKPPRLELAASPAPRSITRRSDERGAGRGRHAPHHAGVQPRAVPKDTEPPVPPGAGRALPAGTGSARTRRRRRQLPAQAQPNEERVTHAISSSSWPRSTRQSWEDGGAGGARSPAALAGEGWAWGHPRDPSPSQPIRDSVGRGQVGPQELDPGLRAQRCPSPGETETQGELQTSRRTQQLTELILSEEAEAVVEPFPEAGEVWQCHTGRAQPPLGQKGREAEDLQLRRPRFHLRPDYQQSLYKHLRDNRVISSQRSFVRSKSSQTDLIPFPASVNQPRG